MKVIIAGSRNFTYYNKLREYCDKILKNLEEDIEIVSGAAKGADKLGERYAREKGYNTKLFPADWDMHGKRAGYVRNKEMAEYADALICFWDGVSKGSKIMIDLAEKEGLKIRVINI